MSRQSLRSTKADRVRAHRPMMESLESRQLMTTLYWAANGPAATGANGVIDLAGANWTSDPSGTGPLQAYAPGDTAVFPDVTLAGGTFVLRRGTTMDFSGNLALTYGGIMNRGTIYIEAGANFNWEGGSLTLQGAALTNLGMLNWNGGDFTINAAGEMRNCYDQGAFNLNSGTFTIAPNGLYQNFGGLVNFNGTTVSIAGSLGLDAGTLNAYTGTLVVESTGGIDTYGNINGLGATWTIHGGFSNQGLLNWSQGSLTFASDATFFNHGFSSSGEGEPKNQFYPGIANLLGGTVTFLSGSHIENAGNADPNPYVNRGSINADRSVVTMEDGVILENDGTLNWIDPASAQTLAKSKKARGPLASHTKVFHPAQLKTPPAPHVSKVNGLHGAHGSFGPTATGPSSKSSGQAKSKPANASDPASTADHHGRGSD